DKASPRATEGDAVATAWTRAARVAARGPLLRGSVVSSSDPARRGPAPQREEPRHPGGIFLERRPEPIPKPRLLRARQRDEPAARQHGCDQRQRRVAERGVPDE